MTCLIVETSDVKKQQYGTFALSHYLCQLLLPGGSLCSMLLSLLLECPLLLLKLLLPALEGGSLGLS